MKLWKKLLIVLLCIVLAPIVAVAVFFFTGGIFGDCSEVVVGRPLISTKYYEASLIEKNCGATTSLATHLKVSRAGIQAKESLFIIESRSPVGIKWASPNHLTVTYAKKDRDSIFKQLKGWNGLRVTYIQLNENN